MQRYFSLLLLACFITLVTNAQTREIKGTVLDAGTRAPLNGVTVNVKSGTQTAHTGRQGTFRLTIPGGPVVLQLRYSGYHTQEVLVKANAGNLVILLQPSQLTLADSAAPVRMEMEKKLQARARGTVAYEDAVSAAAPMAMYAPPPPGVQRDYNTEDYSPINENDFHAVTDQPLSTFSIDVDRAAYSNIRRFLNNGQLPPADAVRVEEMINYFDYQYKAPTGAAPVAIYTDMAICPWNTAHQLVRIGLKGRTVTADKIPPSNLVFLVDVSGSMDEPNKLPLVKQALKTLVQQLRPADKVAIAVYAGAAGLVLPATPGSEKGRILDALDQLQAGGSTAGGEGILLAYKTAAGNFMKEGNNRVIIATDGDFNVGPSSDGELQRIIEKERDKGIFLSVLGFGMGNYKDNKLELLADKGNGNYAYIDNFEEARRTFVTEFGGTLFTIAKDVKLQVEFNPKYVQSYRLVGYENRLLQNEDFNNDKKDAGDMGAGHTVTALYEIVPAGGKAAGVSWVDPLKYQQRNLVSSPANEVLTVKLRYKRPADSQSRLMTQVLPCKVQDITQAPIDFRMCAAVAEFGQLLRGSVHKAQASYSQVLALAKDAKGDDQEGYRAEFIQLVKKAALLQPGSQASRE